MDVTIIQAQLQRDYDEVRTCAARCLRKARRFKDQDRSPDLYEWFMGRYTAFRYMTDRMEVSALNLGVKLKRQATSL